MYQQGFYFSKSIHKDEDGTCWGFWRFNWKNEHSLFDVDFSFGGDHSEYFHCRGDDFRLDLNPETSKQRTIRYSVMKTFPPIEKHSQK
jgi:hypothetical protein